MSWSWKSFPPARALVPLLLFLAALSASSQELVLDAPKTFQEIEFSAACPNVSLNVSADQSGFAKLDSLLPDDFTYSGLLEDGATEFVEGWVYLSPEASANLVVVPPAPLIEQMNVSMEILFTAEPFVEPNDTLEMASITKPGETLRFRLMPRADRDYFRIELPTSGPCPASGFLEPMAA